MRILFRGDRQTDQALHPCLLICLVPTVVNVEIMQHELCIHSELLE